MLQIIILEIAEKGMGLHRKFVCGCFAVDGDSLFYSVWWNAYKGINGDLNGQVVAFFTMVVAACEVVVGLAIIVTIYRSRRSASVDDASLLKR